MAQYRDIDLPAGVQLRINGDLAIPSNNLIVGGTISEGGTLLSAKYLGITATAADSSKLGGVVAANFLRADADDVTTGNLIIQGTTKVAGAFYAGVTGPSNTTRLNYDGALYATQLYDSAVRVAISTRNIIAGTGLTGGGNLTADRTLSVSFAGSGALDTSARSDHDHTGVYLPIAGKAADSELLDGLDSTKFVRNDTTNSIAGLMTITTGGLAVNSGGITSSTTIIFGPTATRGRLNYTTGFVMLEATSTNTGLDLKSTGTGVVNINGNLAYHAGNFTPSQYVKNDTANQQVIGDFSVAGNSTLYVGTAATNSGSIIVKGGGANKIQITGANSVKEAAATVYINASGNAEFAGTVSADKIAVANSVVVPNLNASLLEGKGELEFAKPASILETSGYGVHNGLAVTASTPSPNMQVQIAAGVVYTNSGRRYAISQTGQTINAASATYSRWDIVFIYGDKNSVGGPSGALEGTIGYQAGTAAASPVDPAIPTGAIKLARIILPALAGTVQTANITSLIEWRHFMYDGAGFHVRNQPLSIESSITSDATTVTVTKPIKGTPWAKSNTIAAGQTSVTWTHNLALGTAYVVTWSTNSPNRHVSWSSKATNSIVFNIDDPTDVAIIIDAVITAV